MSVLPKNLKQLLGHQYLLGLLALGANSLVLELQAAERPAAESAAVTNEELLLAAVRESDTAEVERLLALGVNLECVDINGDTPLMLASRNDDSELMRQLLAAGADYRFVDKDGETVLINAVLRDNEVGVCCLLVAAEGDSSYINQTNRAGNTALFLASDKDIIAHLLAAGADATPELERAIQVGGAQATLALRHAVVTGAVELVAQLLECPDIDVNATNWKDETVLMLAISNGHIEVAKLLLAHPNIKINYLSTISEAGTALMAAVEGNKLELVKLLLAQPGIDLNCLNGEGRPALLMADNLEMVQLLLAAGADESGILERALAATNQYYYIDAILRYAVLTDKLDWIRALLAAYPEQVRTCGVENLILASQYGRSALINLLLADEVIAAKLGARLINNAVVDDKSELAELLAIPGINVNAANQAGSTALIMAAYNGRSEIVRRLLAMPGIRVDQTNSTGISALGSAYNRRPIPACADEIVRDLLLAGATISASQNTHRQINRVKTELENHAQQFIEAVERCDLVTMQTEFNHGLYQKQITLQGALQKLVSARSKYLDPAKFTITLDRLLAYGANLNDHTLLPVGKHIISGKELIAGVLAEGASELGPEDFTPLDFAILADQPVYVDALLKRGANSAQINQRSRAYLAEHARNLSHPASVIAKMINDADMAGSDVVRRIIAAEDQADTGTAASRTASVSAVTGGSRAMIESDAGSGAVVVMTAPDGGSWSGGGGGGGWAGSATAAGVTMTIESARIRQYAQAQLLLQRQMATASSRRYVDAAVQCDAPNGAAELRSGGVEIGVQCTPDDLELRRSVKRPAESISAVEEIVAGDEGSAAPASKRARSSAGE